MSKKLTDKVKQDVLQELNRVLDSWGLSNEFNLRVYHSGPKALHITVSHKVVDSPYQCAALTTRGTQCKWEPVMGERFCKQHLTMSKRGQ